MKPPIMLVPEDFGKKVKIGIFRMIGKKLGKYIEKDVKEAMLGDPEDYVISSIFSSLIWGFLLFLVSFNLLYYKAKDVTPSFIAFVGFLFIFLALHFYYPRIIARKIGEEGDRYLVYALRDMWVQISSGVPLYTVLVNVSKGDYGVISNDIKNAISDISSTESEINALEKLSAKTASENFRKVLRHIIVSLRTGIGLSKSIETTLNSLIAEQHRKVRDYSSSLNLYLLLFLTFAAVVPSILITFLSILSVFGVFMITNETIVILIFFSFFMQMFVVGLLSSSRPRIWL
jgi:hypothetical protein